MMTKVKTTKEIAAMRKGGKILAHVLQLLASSVKPDMSTKELSDMAGKELARLGASSACLGYQGFPEEVCISLNDEVVHGIPRENRVIKDNDLISFDLGVIYEGMITDGAITVCINKNPSKNIQQLLSTTEASLLAGIEVIKDGVQVGTIANAVQSVLEEQHYGIVRDLVGHGVGHYFHEDPNIPNFGRANTGLRLQKGMTIAVEPMATLGTHRVYLADDGWTIKTWDGSLSAHFEHTILITESGCEILTQA